MGKGDPEEAGVQFQHLCDTLVASPGLLYVFSLGFCLRLLAQVFGICETSLP